MDQSAMIEHLWTIHGLEAKGLKVNRRMVMHLDCEDSFHSTYEITIKAEGGDIKMTNATANPRSNIRP